MPDSSSVEPSAVAERVAARTNPGRVPVSSASFRDHGLETVSCMSLAGPLTVERQLGGGAAVPEDELFAAIRDIAIDSSGHVYVVDLQEARVQVYDRLGGFRRRLGRRGDGPGEFKYPIGITVAGERVYVADGGPAGVHVFTRDGEFVTRWSLTNVMPDLATAWSIAVAGDHVFVGLSYRFGAEPGIKAEPPIYGVLRTDTLGGNPLLLERLEAEELSSGSYQHIPVLRRYVAADEHYVVVGDVWHSTVRVMSHEGDPLWHFPSCLSYDPNSEPPSKPPPVQGAVGGWTVGARPTALGGGRFARLTPFVDRDGRQHIEVFHVPSRSAAALAVPPTVAGPRRYYGGAVGPQFAVLFNSPDQTVEWLQLDLSAFPSLLPN